MVDSAMANVAAEIVSHVGPIVAGLAIVAGVTAIMKLGMENNFDVDTTTDASKFNAANLKQYAAIIFLSTTGLSSQLFTEEEKSAFMQYIEQGVVTTGSGMAILQELISALILRNR